MADSIQTKANDNQVLVDGSGTLFLWVERFLVERTGELGQGVARGARFAEDLVDAGNGGSTREPTMVEASSVVSPDFKAG